MTLLQVFALIILPAVVVAMGFLATTGIEEKPTNVTQELEAPRGEISETFRLGLFGALAGAAIMGVLGVALGHADRVLIEILGAVVGFILGSLGKLRRII
jgi:hypothetical protein